jgi:hypothetical protein
MICTIEQTLVALIEDIGAIDVIVGGWESGTEESWSEKIFSMSVVEVSSRWLDDQPAQHCP